MVVRLSAVRSILFGSNGNSHAVSTPSDMCMYTYTYSSQYRDSGRAKEKKYWGCSECRLPKKTNRASFWTNASQVSQPWSRQCGFVSVIQCGQLAEKALGYAKRHQSASSVLGPSWVQAPPSHVTLLVSFKTTKATSEVLHYRLPNFNLLRSEPLLTGTLQFIFGLPPLIMYSPSDDFSHWMVKCNVQYCKETKYTVQNNTWMSYHAVLIFQFAWTISWHFLLQQLKKK